MAQENVRAAAERQGMAGATHCIKQSQCMFAASVAGKYLRKVPGVSPPNFFLELLCAPDYVVVEDEHIRDPFVLEIYLGSVGIHCTGAAQRRS